MIVRSRLRSSLLRPRLVPATAALTQLVLLFIVISGGSPWISVAATAVVVGIAIAHKHGYHLAFAATVVLCMASVLLVLMATAATGLPMASGLAVTCAVIGVGASTTLPQRLDLKALVPRLGPWIGSIAGALIIAIAYLISLGQSRNVRLDWVMRNDSANNLSFARIILDRGGISVGGDENPVPVPAALMAVTASAGRQNVTQAGLLNHDLSAAAFTWVVLIALTCVLAGLVASSIADRAGASRWVTVAASTASSLVVLSWMFTGYPMQFGFINTHVALVILLSAILALLWSSRAPWLALTVITGAGLLMLGAWSPLVVVPAGLFGVIVVGRWRQIRQTRGLELALLLVAIVSLAAYGIGVALPVLLAQREALGGLGGIFDFGRVTVFVVGGGVVVLSASAFRGKLGVESLGLIAVVVSTWAGLGVLLLNNRHQVDPWTYYPTKFAWMSLLLYVVIGIGAAASSVRATRGLKLLRNVALAVVGALVAGVMLYVPQLGKPGETQNPVQFMAVGNLDSGYPRLAGYILDLAGKDAPAILWRSGFAGEGTVNIWVMQMARISLDSDLRQLALASYSNPDLANLCRAQQLMGPGLEVHTADAQLESELEAECQGSTATFVVEPPRTKEE